jgi:hypothetical protein
MLARVLQLSAPEGEQAATSRGGRNEMDAQDVNVTMLKVLSATIVYSLGIGVTFSSAIVAVVALLR